MLVKLGTVPEGLAATFAGERGPPGVAVPDVVLEGSFPAEGSFAVRAAVLVGVDVLCHVSFEGIGAAEILAAYRTDQRAMFRMGEPAMLGQFHLMPELLAAGWTRRHRFRMLLRSMLVVGRTVLEGCAAVVTVEGSLSSVLVQDVVTEGIFL